MTSTMRATTRKNAVSHTNTISAFPTTTCPPGQRGCVALASPSLGGGVARTLAEHPGAAAAAGEVVGEGELERVG